MASLNKVILIGNLGKDPELSYTPGGLAVTRFSVATTEHWTDKTNNEKKEKTEWHRVVAFGKLGEMCGKYLAKGRQVYVEGRLQTSEYEKDGVTRYSTDVKVDNVLFLGSKNDGGKNAGGVSGEKSDDDIPF